MNTTFLVITFTVIILAIWGWFNLYKNDFAINAAAAGSICGFVLVAISFLFSVGTTKIVKFPISEFVVEVTPYRVIFNRDKPGQEYNIHKEFTDAKTVTNVKNIKEILLEVPCNAWGQRLLWEIEVRPIISSSP